MYDPVTGKEFSTDPGQDKMLVSFHMDSALNNYKTSQEGRPVYDDVEKVTIIAPGQKNSEFVGRVADEHRFRWPDIYAKFKAGQEQVPNGTPLEQWPWMTKAQVMNLKGVNIHTVEQLGGLPDAGLTVVGMGGRDLRDKAAAWLQSANDGKPLAEALAANEILRQELAVQKQQLDAMQAAIAKLQPSEKTNEQ